MKLFQRVFFTFCTVIICTVFFVSFGLWAVQTRMSETHSRQMRNMESTLLLNTLITLQAQGEDGVRRLFQRWEDLPASKNIIVISGRGKHNILNRKISEEEINQAYNYSLQNRNSTLAFVYYDPFGEEYLLFVRHFDQPKVERMPTLMIPGLPIAPIWHEFIVVGVIFVIGLTLAYLIANNVAKPISILENGMNRLASGELTTRVSHQLDDRKDELASLGIQFDRMAAQLQQLVEKERHLLHHVSHEMRSPLARLQALLGLMQARPEKQNEYIAKLESELTRMDNLVGELLTLSRLETANMAMEKEPLPIVPFMEQLVEDSQAVAEQRGHHITLDTGSLKEEARLQANESYLYRAFDNVIRNAMNYSPEGSTIKIQMHEDRKNLHVEITDNGPGVKPDQLPHIFTAFYRADSSANKPGTGLGLAITKHIAEQHCGKLFAENVQPNGLKMHFVFPKTTVPKHSKKNEEQTEEYQPDHSGSLKE